MQPRNDKPRSILARWHDFWLAPVPPDNLAVCRILFFGSLFLFYTLLPRFGDFAAWGGVPKAFWQPTWLFQVFGIPALRPGILSGLQVIWKVALALSCVGLSTQLSTGISCILGLYLLGLPHNFVKIHHYDAFLVFAFLIMALSRCGDRWSVDEFLRDPRRDGRSRARRTPSGEYTWPVRAMWLVMSLIFFAAAIAKIRHGGLAWITGDSMKIWLVQHQYHISNTDPFTPWGPYIAQVRGLPQVLAAISVTLELAYPLAMFSRVARCIFVPGVALMQLSIHALLGPSFEQQIICNLFWVPWDQVGRWLFRNQWLYHRQLGRKQYDSSETVMP